MYRASDLYPALQTQLTVLSVYSNCHSLFDILVWSLRNLTHIVSYAAKAAVLISRLQRRGRLVVEGMGYLKMTALMTSCCVEVEELLMLLKSLSMSDELMRMVLSTSTFSSNDATTTPFCAYFFIVVCRCQQQPRVFRIAATGL